MTSLTPPLTFCVIFANNTQLRTKNRLISHRKKSFDGALVYRAFAQHDCLKYALSR
jgi:hypothetical protein